MDEYFLSKAEMLVSEIKTTPELKLCLLEFKELLFSKDKPSQGINSSDSVQEVYVSLYDPLVSCLKTSAEICTVALEIHNEYDLCRLLSRCSDISLFLSMLLPVLIELVTEQHLESESVHLIIGEILTNIVTVTDSAQLTAVFQQLISLILELLENSFKEIKAKSCKCISILCKSCRHELKAYFADVIKCLIHCVRHPDYKVRSSALDALGSIAYILNTEETKEFFDCLLGSRSKDFHKIIEFSRENILSSIIRDENVQVRDMFYRVISEWLINLPCKKFLIKRLVPALLIGFFDPIEGVRDTCWEQATELGIKWEKENNCPETLGQTEPFRPYPWHPFFQRTRLGVKRYFNEYFISVFPELLSEIHNFISPHREVAAKLLLALLILSEATNQKNVKPLIINLMASIQDSASSAVSQLIWKSFEVIGRHIPVNVYFPIVSGTRSRPSLLCSLFCTTNPPVSVFAQALSLGYLLKGTLDMQRTSEIASNFLTIKKMMRSIERSRETLFFIQVLIDSDFSWEKKQKKALFQYLIEHDHESVPRYIEKIKEKWYPEGAPEVEVLIAHFMSKILKTGAKDWKASSIYWPIFMNICKFCPQHFDPSVILPIIQKILSIPLSPYHIPSLRLVRYMNILTIEVINRIVVKCLLGSIKTSDISLLRNEALQILKLSELHNVEMTLFEALSACLDDESIHLRSDTCDEIHRQFTFVKIYGVETFTKAKDQSNIVTKLMLKLIAMIDKGEDNLLSCLHPLIDVIGLFPEEIDINAKAWSLVLRRLVAIVMDEEKQNLSCKELAHLCIIAVTNSSKKVIIDELNEIRKDSDKKTGEYIEQMLSCD